MSSVESTPRPLPCLHCKDCPVWKTSLFADLEDRLLNRLAERKTRIKIEKHATAFRQGEAVKGIFCVQQGTFKVLQRKDAFEEKLVRLVPAGGPVGHRSLFTADTYRDSCVAKEPAVVCQIPKDVVLECLEGSTSFSRKFITRISTDLIAAEMQLHSGQTVAQRLAHLLLQLKHDFGATAVDHEECALSIPITKVEIASLLSTSEETIVRTFKDFKRRGWVRFNGKQIILQSEGALRQFDISAVGS